MVIISDQYYIWMISFFYEHPCNCESVTTVIATSTHDQCFRQIYVFCFHRSHTLKCRPFHQDKGRDLHLLYHSLIRSSHLICCQYFFHIRSPIHLIFKKVQEKTFLHLCLLVCFAYFPSCSSLYLVIL